MNQSPALIMVAPNGARRTTVDHPGLPVTPAELARCARDCAAAGAGMMHLHVRDADGGHTLDPAAYRAAIAAIRAETGERLAIQVTTEAVDRYTPGAQIDCIRTLCPEAASVALREVCPPDAEARASAFYHWAESAGIQIQHILYDATEVIRLRELQRRGIIPETQSFVLFVLGRHTLGQVSDPRELLPFLSAWQDAGPWMVCAFGANEARCMAAALALGGHARVGFENNGDLPDGQRAPDNAALVRLTARFASVLGRPLADARAARALGRRRP